MMDRTNYPPVLVEWHAARLVLIRKVAITRIRATRFTRFGDAIAYCYLSALTETQARLLWVNYQHINSINRFILYTNYTDILC
jgi:hypothetical protein